MADYSRQRRVSGAGRPSYGRYGQSSLPQRPRAPRRLRTGTTVNLLRRLPWRILSLVGGTIIVIWFIWNNFSVQQVNVTTPSRSSDVKAEVKLLLAQSTRQGNLLTLQTTKLSSDLKALDPELKGVDIQRSWPHGINVIVTQKQPAFGWSTGNQNYLLDRDGTVIGTLAPGSKLPLVVDGSNLPVQKGQRVVTASFVTFCTEILAGLPSVGLGAVGLRVQDTTFDLYIQTNKSYQLIFDTSRPAVDEIADLKAVQGAMAGKVPTQYIDMRISGKAYYK